jgi:dolichol-phosphate mannosyltransferase
LNPLGYKILLEVLVRGQYRSVKEIPYTFAERDWGNSKLGLRQFFEFVIHLAWLWRMSGELKRVLRHCTVGVSWAFVNMGSLAALSWNGVSYLESGVLAVEAGILTNCLFNEFRVFGNDSIQSKGTHERYKRFLRVHQSCGVGAGINIGVLWFLTERAGIYYIWSNLFGIIGGTLWNYGRSAYLTWRASCADEAALANQPDDNRGPSKIGIG